ncbi:MAG TPA: AmmeMemoRadiSam system protein B [Methanoregulaceae archaeon]|nr:AmmeMemoRadiSam system protein B [Methanoregulaceae archaeon]
MKVRTPAVAGMFYPGEPHHLEQLLERFFLEAGPDRGCDPFAIVAPHAGYVYSGAVAASAYATLPRDFDGTFVVVGPSHGGYPTCASSIPWETPLGIVDVDEDLVRALGVPVNELYMRDEHALEVQMPFIKYRFPRARVAPVMMGLQDLGSAELLGARIERAITGTGRDVRVVASSDFSHYVPAPVARSQDLYAIEALADLDLELFYERIAERRVSACGYGPIAVACTVAEALGARHARLVRYATSGDVTGDHASVVGYAALAVV